MIKEISFAFGLSEYYDARLQMDVMPSHIAVPSNPSLALAYSSNSMLNLSMA